MKHPRAMLITLLLVCALCAAIAVPVAADADDPVNHNYHGYSGDLQPVDCRTDLQPGNSPDHGSNRGADHHGSNGGYIRTDHHDCHGQSYVRRGGRGDIDTYCNVDGAAVSFDGNYQCTIAQGICTVGVSPSGTPVRTITVAKTGYSTWSGSLPHMPANEEHVAVYSTITRAGARGRHHTSPR